jgi:hypothetical protein
LLRTIVLVRRTAVTPEERDVLEAAAEAVAGAGLVLADIAEPHHWKPLEDSPAESEAAEAIAHGLDPIMLPATWRAMVDFSNGAVEHAEALGAVLRGGHTLTVPMMARAVIEHAQAACWLLEPTHGGAGTLDARVTAKQRAARGQLEELFSARHYRDTLKKLAKTTSHDSAQAGLLRARQDLKDLREKARTVFGPDTKVEREPSAWRIAEQALPSPTGASEWFFGTMTLGSGLGVYDALSGYTHPTLWSLREHQHVGPTADGGVDLSWSVSSDFVSRVCGTTASTLYRVLCQLAGYFGWDKGRIHLWSNELNAWCPELIRE